MTPLPCQKEATRIALGACPQARIAIPSIAKPSLTPTDLGSRLARGGNASNKRHLPMGSHRDTRCDPPSYEGGSHASKISGRSRLLLVLAALGYVTIHELVQQLVE